MTSVYVASSRSEERTLPWRRSGRCIPFSTMRHTGAGPQGASSFWNALDRTWFLDSRRRRHPTTLLENGGARGFRGRPRVGNPAMGYCGHAGVLEVRRTQVWETVGGQFRRRSPLLTLCMRSPRRSVRNGFGLGSEGSCDLSGRLPCCEGRGGPGRRSSRGAGLRGPPAWLLAHTPSGVLRDLRRPGKTRRLWIVRASCVDHFSFCTHLLVND